MRAIGANRPAATHVVHGALAPVDAGAYGRAMPADDEAIDRSIDDTTCTRVERVVEALADECGNIDRDTLTVVVEADFRRYSSTARVQDFVPVFVERDVRARLRRRYGQAPRRP
jgi:hypothetical protein